jgi:hypothetical protein
MRTASTSGICRLNIEFLEDSLVIFHDAKCPVSILFQLSANHVLAGVRDFIIITNIKGDRFLSRLHQ